ncbi:LuxR C-terminal-related transcriptional regulator [Streptomyces sp. NPDC003077]|uniref:LuxR C-terminal-related transcriptional regulator n=1 Tax=Streptomyces sp. NPDC003077 TaxID=3154443 RepID=UPI0033BC2AD2
MIADVDPSPAPVIGRAAELRAVGGFLDRARVSGGVMSVHGELGSGKSALLEEARRGAETAGYSVVRLQGRRTEAALPGAGLTQLLPVPVLPARGPSAAGTAAEALDRHAFPGRPLLVTLDDAQWFDGLSLDALLGACRGAGRVPVALLLSSRPVPHRGARHLSGPAPDLLLGPLAVADAERLLRRHGRDLPPPLAERVLRETGGNPAGVVSVARLLRSSPPSAEVLLAPRLPLGDVLHARVSRLLEGVPGPVRDFLLLAAVARTDRLDLLREAAGTMGTADGAPEAAEARGLLTQTSGRVRFVHPLLRSAVYWDASSARRRRAHLALAGPAEPSAYQRALHRALACALPDEATARELEDGVPRGLPEAGAVHELAADLSPRPADRARRLVAAAWAAQVRDRTEELRRLMSRLTALSSDQDPATAAALAARPAHRDDGGPARALDPLPCHAGGPVPAWPPSAAGAVPDSGAPTATRSPGARPEAPVPDTPRRAECPSSMSALCWADRAAHADRGRALLATAGAAPRRGRFPLDPARDAALVSVATALDDPRAAARLGGAVLESLTGLGYFGTARTVLAYLQIAHVHLGDRAGVLRDADTGERWSRAAGDPRAAAVFRCGVAQVRAWEGTEEGHRAFTDRVLAYALPRRLPLVAARARWARGLMALSHGRPEDAYEELRMLSDPDGDARHPVVAAWALGDLVAAAVASGREGDVREHVRRMAGTNRLLRSAPLDHLLARSLALLGDGDGPEELFTRALAVPGAEALRYEQARTRLAFGEWLRRRRRVLEARDQLRRARDAFASVGADVWVRRADSELLAAGQASHPSRAEAELGLTPREAEVARLAAEGLSNQGIGWRLGLTHRTVASHLSRVFAKAGVTSRKQLPAVLRR